MQHVTRPVTRTVETHARTSEPCASCTARRPSNAVTYYRLTFQRDERGPSRDIAIEYIEAGLSQPYAVTTTTLRYGPRVLCTTCSRTPALRGFDRAPCAVTRAYHDAVTGRRVTVPVTVSITELSRLLRLHPPT